MGFFVPGWMGLFVPALNLILSGKAPTHVMNLAFCWGQKLCYKRQRAGLDFSVFSCPSSDEQLSLGLEPWPSTLGKNTWSLKPHLNFGLSTKSLTEHKSHCAWDLVLHQPSGSLKGLVGEGKTIKDYPQSVTVASSGWVSPQEELKFSGFWFLVLTLGWGALFTFSFLELFGSGKKGAFSGTPSHWLSPPNH